MKSEIYRKFSDGVYNSADDFSEATGKRVPADVMIELPRLCSIKCTHCYIGDARWVRDPNEMSTEQVKELMDLLAEKGTLWVTFTGGEAMMPAPGGAAGSGSVRSPVLANSRSRVLIAHSRGRRGNPVATAPPGRVTRRPSGRARFRRPTPRPGPRSAHRRRTRACSSWPSRRTSGCRTPWRIRRPCCW